MTSTASIQVSTYLNLEDLADELARTLGHHRLIDFLALVDAERAEVEFTMDLVEKLGEALKDEGFIVTIEEINE